MTEPELAALEHIRRVVDSVVGEPLPPGMPPAAASGAAALLPVPYVSQPGEGADQYTNASGAAAGVMLVHAYTDKSVTPNTFFNQSGLRSDKPLSLQQIITALTVNGVTTELRTGLKIGDLALVLFTGRPAILPVKHAVLKAAGLTPETFDGPHYLAAIGLDVNQIYIHDPLRKDDTGKAQGIPWLTFYQAWMQAPGTERVALIPRLGLFRRVRVTAATLNMRQEPNAKSALAGTVKSGEVFELIGQKDGWGKISEGRWISLSYVTDI